MLLTAFVFALCFFGCIALLFIKLPKVIQRFFLKHQLIADGSATGITFLSLTAVSSSALAAMASAMAGVMFSLYLWLYKQFTSPPANKDKASK